MGTKDGGKKPDSGDYNRIKSLMIYMATIFLVTSLLNALIFPSLGEKVKEVGYNDFLTMVDAGKVIKVESGEDALMFLARDAN